MSERSIGRKVINRKPTYLYAVGATCEIDGRKSTLDDHAQVRLLLEKCNRNGIFPEGMLRQEPFKHGGQVIEVAYAAKNTYAGAPKEDHQLLDLTFEQFLRWGRPLKMVHRRSYEVVC